jgi:hypothetical protein
MYPFFSCQTEYWWGIVLTCSEKVSLHLHLGMKQISEYCIRQQELCSLKNGI